MEGKKEKPEAVGAVVAHVAEDLDVAAQIVLSLQLLLVVGKAALQHPAVVPRPPEHRLSVLVPQRHVLVLLHRRLEGGDGEGEGERTERKEGKGETSPLTRTGFSGKGSPILTQAHLSSRAFAAALLASVILLLLLDCFSWLQTPTLTNSPTPTGISTHQCYKETPHRHN